MANCVTKFDFHLLPFCSRYCRRDAKLVDAVAPTASNDAPSLFDDLPPSQVGLHAEHRLTEQYGCRFTRQARVFRAALDKSNAVTSEARRKVRHHLRFPIDSQISRRSSREHLL